MDPVTHTLIGVGMGNAFFRKSVGRGTAPVLGIASNLPDIDAIVHLSGDPASILMRRTFGHSVLLFPIWAMILAVILRRLYPHVGLKKMYALCLLGASVHVFFDLVNSFGVVLFWPVSDWRPELGIIFIIDLALTGLLLLPLCLCIPPFMRVHLATLSRVAIGCVAAYVLFCGTARAMADRALTDHVQSSGAHPEFQYVFPEPFGPHRWRGVTREGGLYRVYMIHPLSSKIEPRGMVGTQPAEPHVMAARATHLAKRLEWFFKAPVWKEAAGPPGGPAQVSVYDLRFKSLLVPRNLAFLFRFDVYDDGRVDRIVREGRTVTLTSPE